MSDVGLVVMDLLILVNGLALGIFWERWHHLPVGLVLTTIASTAVLITVQVSW